MKYFAIASSIPEESDVLLRQLKNLRREKIAGRTLFRGELAKSAVLLMNTGIGKVNAAHTATVIHERYAVNAFMNIGVGGAYPNARLETGDIAVALKEISCDEGVIGPQGWKGIRETGLPLIESGQKKYYNEFPVDRGLAQNCLHAAYGITRAQGGNFITVSAATGTHRRALQLEKRFNGLCENMEGSAIAHVCALYRVPFLEVRGISNIVGIRDKRRWRLKRASENCQKAVLNLLGNL